MSKEVTIPKGYDSTHRYKRELLVSNPFGSIKTKLENLDKICKKLQISPEIPLKFIGFELGSQTDCKNNEFTINGMVSNDELEKYLEKFITKYIICQKKECSKPEIQIKIKGKEINQKCTACGEVCALDNKHKIANLIIKNPPEMNNHLTEKKNNIKDTKKEKGNDIADFKQAIKQNIKKLKEIDKKNDDNGIRQFLKNELKSSLNAEGKYFVIFHGLFDRNIYDNNFEKKAQIIREVIENEEISKEEISFHLYCSLIDLIYNLLAKDPTSQNDLFSKIPSLCYIFYKERLFTENFINERLIKPNLIYENFVYSEENDKNFLHKAYPFLHWYQNAPFEDEEGTYAGLDSQTNSINDL